MRVKQLEKMEHPQVPIWDWQHLNYYHQVPDNNFIRLLDAIDLLQDLLIRSHDTIAIALNGVTISNLNFSRHVKAMYAANELEALLITYDYCTQMIRFFS